MNGVCNNNDGLLIVSRSEEPFNNRLEAGKLLGLEIKRFQYNDPVVLGIPRGGMVIANEIAKVLGADLDIILTHKLGAPANSEFAIGSVGENGEVFINEDTVKYLGITSDYIMSEKERQLELIKQRLSTFREIHSKVSLEGKTAIVTDDGVATGSTMQAALWNIRQENPKEIIVALPVGPEETLQRLTKDADKVICLRVPSLLQAIGQYYAHFEQVEDGEVLEILNEYSQKGHSHA